MSMASEERPKTSPTETTKSATNHGSSRSMCDGIKGNDPEVMSVLTKRKEKQGNQLPHLPKQEEQSQHLEQVLSSSGLSSSYSPTGSNSGHNNSITTTTQTRFSFYDASEVQSQFVSSIICIKQEEQHEQQHQEQPQQLTSFDSSENKSQHRYNFYDPSSLPTYSSSHSFKTESGNNGSHENHISTMPSSVSVGYSSQPLLPSHPLLSRENLAVVENNVLRTGSNPRRTQPHEHHTRHPPQQQQLQLDQHRRNASQTRLQSSTSYNSHNSHTEDILRSLQETEEQRMQILQPTTHLMDDDPPVVPFLATRKATGHPTTSRSLIAGLNDTSSSITGKSNDSYQNHPNVSDSSTTPSSVVSQLPTLASTTTAAAPTPNPYEDAIREALDLLRKHRSPPTSPSINLLSTDAAAVATDAHAATTTAATGSVHTQNVHSSGTTLVVQTDQLLHSTGQQEGSVLTPSSTDGILISPNNRFASIPSNDSLTDAIQEAKLKSKQRQERMAEYANRLQEFKSSLPPGDDDQNHQQQQQNQQQAITPLVQQMQSTDLETEHTTHPSSNSTNDVDSVGLISDISLSTRQYYPPPPQPTAAQINPSLDLQPPLSVEEEVQKGVEKVLLAILEASKCSTTTTSSQGNNSIHSQTPQGGDGGQSVRTADDTASTQSGSTTHNIVSQVLLKAMDEVLNGRGLLNRRKTSEDLSSLPGTTHTDNASALYHHTVNVNDAYMTNTIAVAAAPTNTVAAASLCVKNDFSISHESRRTTKRSGGAGAAEHRSVVEELLAEPDHDDYDNNINNVVPPRTAALYWPREEKKTTEHDSPTTNTNNMAPSTMTATTMTTTTTTTPTTFTSYTVPTTNRMPTVAPTTKTSTTTTTTKTTLSQNISDKEDVDASIDESTDEARDQEASFSEEFELDEEEEEEEDEEEEEEEELNSDYDHDSSYDEEEEESNDDENDDTPDMRVLGRLSHNAGGTTGVVLDTDSPASPESGDKATKGYFSNVVKYVTTTTSSSSSSSILTSGRQRVVDHRKRKVAPPDSGDTEESSDEDSESMELMRTLCAHLLPFGVDQRSILEEVIPVWDEDNPNEAGYRIIRLSKAQLRRVEKAFDSMINGLKYKSHRQLKGVDGEYDESFIRELQEAERLLDDQEKRNRRGNAVVTKEVLVIDSNTKKTKDNVATRQNAHPDFPGIRAAGEGEMGDLEFFHLPIIFKSHVTGFEPTKDMVLEPGNVVAGQYLVEGELGSAAFSTAYRCIDLSSDNQNGHEEVCLKVIKNTKDFFDQSLDEIKILELLRQTGKCDENFVIRMKTFFYYREHLVIVTELLRQNLFEFGKFIMDNDEEPYFTIPRLAYITRQCLMALRFVHGLGLVHSDIKPENILLGSYSRAKIKIIDFGSSCYLTDRQSSYIQSRSYRAPEVVLGLPYSGKIDVWSLGCVVAEMYTGEVTFQNDSIVSMLSRIEAICGSFPRHMIAQGRQSGRFFTKSGLLYEVVDDSDSGSRNIPPPGPNDEDSDSESDLPVHFDIFQPKITRLSSRLGFDADLMDDYENNRYSGSGKVSEHELQQIFTDFIARLLTIDPDSRPTADKALQHPWMLYAATLTEAQIKYP